MVSCEDAEAIMKALLAMRGCDKKKHMEAWSQGALWLTKGELKLQGTSQKWRTAAGRDEPWIDEYAPPVSPQQQQADAHLDSQLVAVQTNGS